MKRIVRHFAVGRCTEARDSKQSEAERRRVDHHPGSGRQKVADLTDVLGPVREDLNADPPVVGRKILSVMLAGQPPRKLMSGLSRRQSWRDQSLGNHIEIGNDIVLDPAFDLIRPSKGDVKLLTAILGNERKRDELAPPAIIFCIEKVAHFRPLPFGQRFAKVLKTVQR